MKKILFKLLFIFLFVQNIVAQTLVTAIVSDSKGKPIENVNIYLSNSKIGTKTNAKGRFRFQNLPIGRYEIIASHISFKVQSRNIEFKIPNQKLHITFTLPEKLEQLENVDIKIEVDKKWKRQLRQFKTAFLGTSQNAQKCKILNPWVIDFEQEGNTFIAKASEPIKIENRATGYKMYFFLSLFEKEYKNVTYAGKPFFEELTSQDPKEQQLWIRNRAITYNGSKRHFLKSLLNKKLEEDGFEINKAKKDRLRQNMTVLGSLEEKNIIQRRANNQYIFYFNDFLQIVYNNQKSYIFAKTKIILLANGNMKNPQDLKEYGFWASERIAELLPLDIDFKTSKI